MKKMRLLIFLVVLLFSIDVKAIDINSKYAILYNLDTSEVFYTKDSDKVISIASLTKIMTSILAIENIDDLNTKVMVPYGTNYGLVERGAARVGFLEGSMVTYNDLLHGALLPSGADSTRALSILISGSEEDFVSLMNQKAKELGMNNTNFVNSHGLDADNHYSTLEDMLKLLKYALKNETFKKIFTTKTYISSDNRFNMESTVIKSSRIYNVDVSNIVGSKTGFTYDAGQCLASLLNVYDNDFILITAKAEYENNLPNHIMDFNKVYSYVNENYIIREISKPNTLVLTLKPQYSKEEKIDFYTENSIYKLVKNNKKNELEYVYNGKEHLIGNEKKGTYLGSVDIIYDGEVIDTLEVKLKEDLTFDYFKYLSQYFYLVPIILGLFVLIFILRKRLKKA